MALADYSSNDDSVEVVAIVRDDRNQEDDGTYNFSFESENGISVSESGSPDGPEGAIISSGQYS